jgi:hypothetical protein
VLSLSAAYCSKSSEVAAATAHACFELLHVVKRCAMAAELVLFHIYTMALPVLFQTLVQTDLWWLIELACW